MRFGVLPAMMLAVVVCGNAQDDEAPFRAAMKQTMPLNGGLGKKIAAKDAAAAEDAGKLQAIFGEAKKFWEGRSVADAVELSATAANGFGDVAKLIGEGKWDEAAAAQKKASGTCMGCHSAHREKAPDGSWKIK